jgi:hypothetical protein
MAPPRPLRSSSGPEGRPASGQPRCPPWPRKRSSYPATPYLQAPAAEEARGIWAGPERVAVEVGALGDAEGTRGALRRGTLTQPAFRGTVRD